MTWLVSTKKNSSSLSNSFTGLNQAYIWVWLITSRRPPKNRKGKRLWRFEWNQVCPNWCWCYTDLPHSTPSRSPAGLKSSLSPLTPKIQSLIHLTNCYTYPCFLCRRIASRVRDDLTCEYKEKFILVKQLVYGFKSSLHMSLVNNI